MVPLNQVVRDSIEQYSKAPYIDLKNPKLARVTNNFIQSAVKVVNDTFKVYSKNRARTRRKLRRLIADWEGLQAEADAADVQLDQIIQKVDPARKRGTFLHFLTSWVYHHKTRFMLDWIWLGFETETFVPHEALMELWYGDCLHNAHIQNSNMVSFNITDPTGQLREKGFPQDVLPLSDLPFQSARQVLVRAILQTLCACKTEGLYTAPNFEFLDPKVHYHHRFAVFTRCATPTTLTYEQFITNVTFTQAQVADLHSLAEASLKISKNSIERCLKSSPAQAHVQSCAADYAEELKAMARVCISNTLALKAIKTHSEALAKDPAGTPVKVLFLDFKYHPHFPVLSLVSPPKPRSQ